MISDEKLKERVLDIIRNDPHLRYMIERVIARIRFEKINGIESESTCQK